MADHSEGAGISISRGRADRALPPSGLLKIFGDASPEPLSKGACWSRSLLSARDASGQWQHVISSLRDG